MSVLVRYVLLPGGDRAKVSEKDNKTNQCKERGTPNKLLKETRTVMRLRALMPLTLALSIYVIRLFHYVAVQSFLSVHGQIGFAGFRLLTLC